MLFIIMIVFGLLSMLVSTVLKNKFTTYSRIPLISGLSGKEVAERMLKFNGIYDVQITNIPGQLTDHYNPLDKTVNLSPEVYEGRSIASAAIAAHECGHAVQHATAYSMLMLRSRLVPIVNISSNIMRWVFIFGIGFYVMQSNYYVLLVIIVLQAIVTLFSIITLPVEFDASKRGLVFIQESGIIKSDEEYKGAKDALTWAGLTYFVAALASVAQLLYFLLRLNGSRRSND
ncbi:MAG: zinc metallopeptidase [Bacteroidota bacterium]